MSEEKPKEEKKKREIPLPDQFHRLVFEGRKAIQFWVRAFDLEKEIERVGEILGEKPDRKQAAVPISAEYEIDERLKAIFVILCTVDALGIQDGLGVIYWASPEHAEEAYKIRDKYAADLLKHMQTVKGFDEVVELERKREE